MSKPYYQDDWVTIYHGDCREILPDLPKVDLVLTDPPYGIDADAKQANRAGKQHGAAMAPSSDYGDTRFDHEPPDSSTLDLCLQAGTNAIVFGGNYFKLPPSSCWLVWDKDNGSNGYADCELAWTNLPGAVRLLKWRWHGMLQQFAGKDKEQRQHPTQKPVDVMRWAILRTETQTILDPFMGSGTTLRAAKDLNRKAIGIEIEEKYCEIAAQRMSQEVFDFTQQDK